MKPGDHPDFFRLPAPEGRSRESEIRLDAEGHFHDHGERVEHAKLAQAMHTWIGRHPDDHRYILTNGYDWTYFTVDDVPYFVRSVRLEKDRAVLLLDDETEEPLVPAETAARPGAEALYTRVKRDARGGPFEAKFTRHAQTSLAPVLAADDQGKPGLAFGGRFERLGS